LQALHNFNPNRPEPLQEGHFVLSLKSKIPKAIEHPREKRKLVKWIDLTVGDQYIGLLNKDEFKLFN
jgi:desulfoferrodoxin (superoxide reductase-like protein)